MSVFDTVKVKRQQSNLFNLSFDNKCSMEMGKIYPIACKPVIPGDTFRWNTEVFIRLAPMLAPVMDSLDVRIEYFYCPNRILCDDERNWERFISPAMTFGTGTGSEQPIPETTPPCFVCSPVTGAYGLDDDAFKDGELLDFLGYHMVPAAVARKWPMSLLPINMYNKVYYEYYQDQNIYEGLVDNLDYPLLGRVGGYGENNEWRDVFDTAAGATGPEDGADLAMSYFRLRTRAWKKDYFTSALPWTQRGADVHLPLYENGEAEGTIYATRSLGVEAPNWSIDYIPETARIEDMAHNAAVVANLSSQNGKLNLYAATQDNTYSRLREDGYVGRVSQNEVAQALRIKLENINAATINEFRRANALQKYLEISARVGSRYKEFVYGHFGVTVPDSRLQRPEYLGGFRIPVKISEVLQTSETTASSGSSAGSPLGDMAGHGAGYGSANGFTREFDEHGYIMCMMTIMPKASYYQGIEKDRWKMDRLDWYNPEFANIGEQEIKEIELYCNDSNASTLDRTFGYTPRYAEYKFSMNEIHGDFRGNLDYWHMARKFNNAPVLNNSFIKVSPINRIFAVEGGGAVGNIDHFYVAIHHDVRAKRLMPYFGTPIL